MRDSIINGLSLILPEKHVSLRGLVCLVLCTAWVYWAMGRLARGLAVACPILGFNSIEILDNLRDDIQDRTGRRVSRSALTELVINSLYTCDALLTDPKKWGQFILLPADLSDRINHMVNCLTRGDGNLRFGADSLNHASLTRVIAEAACDADPLKMDRCGSLDDLKGFLVERLRTVPMMPR